MDDRMPLEVFIQNIQEIKHLSDKIDDGWEILESLDDGNTYIKKKTPRLIKKTKNLEESSEVVLYFYEYHVVYNKSYGVPMLCFNVWDSDGRLLKMNEVWEHFNPYYRNENMYRVLTQHDHPVLLTPILMLHPCRTAELMSVFLKTSKNPVVSWLSTSGPAVNLLINNDYEQLTKKGS